jgi:hypothetical protein
METLAYGDCRLSLVPVRAEAREASEMVNQLIFGDRYRVVEYHPKGEWVKISSTFDDYTGWIGSKLHHEISEQYFQELEARTPVISLSRSAALTINGAVHHVVLGSQLPLQPDSMFQRDEYVRFEGKSHTVKQIKDVNILKELAAYYINTPYLWGGKSPYGIDCSGFTQMVYRMAGYALKRDASQQAKQGIKVALAEVTTGDLAFFNNAEGRITHVGLMIGQQEIIHASGFVRIDRLDEKGIWNQDIQKHTHSLTFIKRMVS